MESLIMSSRVVLPMAIIIGIGMLLRTVKLTDEPTMKKVDKLVFNLCIPMLCFYNIYETDFSKLENISYILFGAVFVFLLFLGAMFLVPKFVKPMPTAASLGQAIFRSNFLIFGAAVAESIYGTGNIGKITLMAAVVVPFYNALATILLERARNGSTSPRKLLLAVFKNPVILSMLLGIVVNLLGIRIPVLMMDVVQDLAGLTTPLSFLSIGVTLEMGAAVSNKRYLTAGIVLRLIVTPMILLPLSIVCGFRGQELCALMILFASPVAVSSYPMAVAMDADAPLAAQMVAYTTVFCLPTIFLWTLLLNAMGWM